MKKLYSSKVIHGNKEGRKIGFPTLNLIIPQNFEIEKGVHAAYVDVKDHKYKGLLYFGPRLVKDETFDILEIHLLEFMDEIYGDIIEFETISFIREPKDFSSMEDLKQQIEQDVLDAERIFSE